MEPLTIALLVIGLLIALFGGIMLLVAAFRESIWWGLATLLLSPVASLIFTIVHWSKARTAFVLNVLGTVVIGGAIVASPAVRKQVAEASGASLWDESAKGSDKTADLSAQIQEKREQIEQDELRFRQMTTELSQDYATLQTRRATLKSDDNASVAAFNTDAATYQQKNTALKELRTKVDAAQLELTGLLDQRSRQASVAAPRGSAKTVVMYTTASCPACKAAKDYMARRGIQYQEKNVEQSNDARAEFDRLGGRGVPLIMVDRERMEGFSAQRLDQLL